MPRLGDAHLSILQTAAGRPAGDAGSLRDDAATSREIPRRTSSSSSSSSRVLTRPTALHTRHLGHAPIHPPTHARNSHEQRPGRATTVNMSEITADQRRPQRAPTDRRGNPRRPPSRGRAAWRRPNVPLSRVLLPFSHVRPSVRFESTLSFLSLIHISEPTRPY